MQAKNAENRLTLKAMDPKGKKVKALASRLYVGKPAGWLTPSVNALTTNSGESR
jgi:hypothetical protein